MTDLYNRKKLLARLLEDPISFDVIVNEYNDYLILTPQEINLLINKWPDPDILEPVYLYQIRYYPIITSWESYLKIRHDYNLEETKAHKFDGVAMYCMVGVKEFYNNLSEKDLRKLLTVPHLGIDKTWEEVCQGFNDEELNLYHRNYGIAKQIVDACEVKEIDLADGTNFEKVLNYAVFLKNLSFKYDSNTILQIILGLFYRITFSMWDNKDYLEFAKEFLIILSGNANWSDSVIEILSFLKKLFENDLGIQALYLKEVVSIDNFKNYHDHLLSLIENSQNLNELNEIVSNLLIFELKQITSNQLESFIEILYKDCEYFLNIDFLNTDPTIMIGRLLVDIFVKIDDVDEARSVYEKVLSHNFTRHWAWLMAIYFEKRFGDHDKLNKLYLQVTENVLELEWAEPLLVDWIKYEQINGNKKNLKFAEKKVSQARKLLFEKLQAQEEIVVDEEEDDSNKRSSEEIINNDITKKQKVRDREHLKIKVTNLSPNTNEKDLRKFFQDCGEIKEVQLLEDENQAILEFAEELGLLSALTKTFKKLKGSNVEINRILNATIFVTNFSSLETEESIAEKFSPFGKIISIRFPSLKFNQNRRFCYIEYLNPESAIEAIKTLNNKPLSEDYPYNVVIKISDPDKRIKKQEIIVKNLNFDVTLKNLQDFFQDYESIEKINLPMNNGKNKGYGFIIFDNEQEAHEAVEKLNNKILKNRSLEIMLANKQKQKSILQTSGNNKQGEISDRIITILNLPDTINVHQLQQWIISKIKAKGKILKIDLRSNKQLALIEFEKVEDAGNCGLILNGEELQGKVIKVGTRKDFEITKKSKMMVPTNVIRRRKKI